MICIGVRAYGNVYACMVSSLLYHFCTIRVTCSAAVINVWVCRICMPQLVKFTVQTYLQYDCNEHTAIFSNLSLCTVNAQYHVTISHA